MTREQATTEATEIAHRNGIQMVVTFDPYAENLDESQNYGYHPHAAVGIFNHEEVVETIRLKGEANA